MAAFFTAASSQYLLNSTPPVTAIPFTIGMWFNMPTGATTPTLWSLANGSTDTSYWNITKNASNFIVFECNGTTGLVSATTATAITSNAWTFVLARAISATNRRISVQHATGTIDNAQNTTSRTPVSVSRMAIGAYMGTTLGFYTDGSIGEYWMANIDVQPGGAAMQAALLRRLAYGGPFSVPHIRRNIVDYRSLRSSLTLDRPPEFFNGRVRQTWANTNGVTLGPHPPLPGTYQSPRDVRRIGLI